MSPWCRRTARTLCPAEALLQNGGPAAVGEVEQVLHADDAGPGRSLPELSEADVTQAYPGDESRVAGRHHRGQLVIEAGVDAPVTGQAMAHPALAATATGSQNHRNQVTAAHLDGH